MSPKAINPDTNQPIQSLHEFDRVADRLARQAAGLPEYAMDDPERPFTPEYDAPVSVDVAVVEPEPSPQAARLKKKTDAILGRVAAKKAASLAALDETMEEREDPWGSLGGGHDTYHADGRLAAGRAEDATTQVTHGRGGKLVTRVELSGRFIDVPVLDGPGQGSNSNNVERAKEQLALGNGTPVSRLRHKSKK